ncbi:hypothetical protein K461DRAFT_292186 [Myriangium duriaei CBS 260.36]|uniref:Swiss Army Knife RNA repair protein HAD domain-containing protein n=1 Tax=Myriangium duriaei CBS 260.36 TaxID=1168546 RepID=A0A9P4J748_9PEZI|nr:hypothetical protein K461DRAFT_292186 [Myriangium duriaei CBS 260.36]
MTTTTGLSRWSCTLMSIPDAERITEINVYDFDNTLFRTPLPSRFVWEGPTIGLLQGQDIFTGGGWWHDPHILASVGGGIEKMEPTAWEGWWQEDVVASARKSIATPGHLTVLMTGRSQANFSELITRIVKAKGLQFDMVVLKPEITPTGEKVTATAKFKTMFFQDAMTAYPRATRLTIYEDRAKQANEFAKYLDEWNVILRAGQQQGEQPASRPAFDWHIELVDPASIALEPEGEISQVKRMINGNNAILACGKASSRIRPYKFETVRKYTGYLIAPFYASKLKKLLVPEDPVEPDDIRPLADSIMISFDPPRRDVLGRAGGTGAKQEWRTVAVGNNKNSIWAVRVEPVDSSLPHPTERNPIVILGHLPKVKTGEARYIKSWTRIPADQQIVFPTEVGDRVLVRVVEDRDSDFATNPRVAVGQVRDKTQMQARRDQRHPHQYGGDQSSADDSDVAMADSFPPLGRPNQPQHHHQQRGRGRGASAYASTRGRDRPAPYNQAGRGGYAAAAGGRGRHGGPSGGGGARGNARGGRGGRSGQYRSLDDAGQNGYGGAEGMQY